MKVIHLTGIEGAENPRYRNWLFNNHRGGMGPINHWPLDVETFTIYAPWKRIKRMQRGY